MFIKERLNLKKSNLPPHPPQNNKKQVISIKVKMKRETKVYLYSSQSLRLPSPESYGLYSFIVTKQRTEPVVHYIH